MREAVKIMGEVQLGVELSPEEIEKIVAFLDSLIGAGCFLTEGL